MGVKVYKLISGEDIIADIDEETSLEFVLKNPAAIVVQQTADGRVGAAFAPFAPFAKDNIVRIYKTAIAGHMEVDIKLINEYNRIFGSGIMIASANEMPQLIV
jgi:hypothetical protein